MTPATLALWHRSSRYPLTIQEVVQAIVVLSFAIVLPDLLIPALAVILLALLDRVGLTLLGKVVVMLAVIALVWAAWEPLKALVLEVFTRFGPPPV